MKKAFLVVTVLMSGFCVLAAFAACGTAEALTLASGEISLDATRKAVVFRDTRDGTTLLSSDHARLLLPSFAADACCTGCEKKGETLVFTYGAPSLRKGEVTVRRALRGFLMDAEFVPSRNVVLARLDVFPADTRTNFVRIDNFLSTRGHPRQVFDVILGGRFEAHTLSDVGEFTPRPSSMLLVRDDLGVLVGVAEIPVGAYGMRANGKMFRFDEFSLDYGGAEWGWKLKAGETWRAPQFYMAAERSGSALESHRLFATDLVSMGRVADFAKRKVPVWNRRAQYCTWGESHKDIPGIDMAKYPELKARHPGMRSPGCMHLNEKTVLAAARKIRAERLPIDSICLDEGWSEERGNWMVNEELFPHFRAMIDELHAMGFKVVCWWTWCELDDEASAACVPKELCLMNGKLDKYGRPQPDYSKKATQERYLKPMLRRLFSSEPGCYDLDGMKIDFTADKVHPELPCEDPAWRGEQSYLHHLYSMIRSEIARYKPEMQMCGTSIDWFFADCFDTIRTMDVVTDDWREHEARSRVFQACLPGIQAKYDFSGITRQGYPAYFESARRIGAVVEMGYVFTMRDLVTDSIVPTSAADFEMFRNGLKP